MHFSGPCETAKIAPRLITYLESSDCKKSCISQSLIRLLMKIRQSKRPSPPTALRRAPPSCAEGGKSFLVAGFSWAHRKGDVTEQRADDGVPQLRVPERWRWNDAFTFVETVRFLRNDCAKTLSPICMSDTISRQTMQWLAIFQYDSTGQGLFQASKQLCAFYCCKTFPFLQDWCLQGPAFLELVSDWPSVKFIPLNTLV